MNTINIASRRLLPVMEWMAENAFIPPGTHRLLAAGGLSTGLWGGRHFMDVVVGKNSDGTDMTREQAPAILRPIHGILHYNRYSDSPVDRWKGVVDRLVPGTMGAMAAYYGSRYFFHGTAPKLFGGKAMHALSQAAEKAVASGAASSQMAEHAASLAQSEVMARGATFWYDMGASVGTDKMGALLPTNQNMWANRFALGAGIKSKIPFAGWFNRVVLHSYGDSSLAMPRAMRSAAKWMEGNLYAQGDPAKWLNRADTLRWAKDALQNLPHHEAHLEKVAAGIETLAHNAWAGMQAMERSTGRAVSAWTAADKNAFYAKHVAGDGSNHGFIGVSFDRWMHHMGVPLGDFELADHGFLTKVSRLFGSGKLEAPAREAYKRYLETNFPGVTFNGPITPTLSPREKLLLGGALAGGTLAAIGGGAVIAAHTNKRIDRLTDDTTVTGNHLQPLAPEVKPSGQGNLLDWVNGTPLDMAQWLSRLMIIPPSMHRLMSAAYLSAGLYGGMQLANALTGHKLPALRGGSQAMSELPKESFKGIWRPLRAVHGLLHYTPGSSALRDRWRQAAHFLIPIPIGVLGNSFGSHSYFEDRIKKLEKPLTLEDYTDRISMEQSGVFANLTAITSIFNTGSGLHLMPFINYSSNMQSRFVLGNGLQIATPGIGKWWSGNPGLTPWGIKRTLAYVGNYLGQNEAARPIELPSLIHSVLTKLYPKLPEEQLLIHKSRLLSALYEVRDTYLVDGIIPTTLKTELTKTMTTLVTGHGFESLLQQSGLNPAEADLSNNGVSGKFANMLGRGQIVRRLEDDYHRQFSKRLTLQPTQSPRDYLQQLANHSGKIGMNANDNQPQNEAQMTKSQPFAQRLNPGRAANASRDHAGVV